MPDETPHTSLPISRQGSVSHSKDANSHGKKAQLRNSRFKGSSIPRRSLTPSSLRLQQDLESPNSPVSSHSPESKLSDVSPATFDRDVLQEISNSSLRRKIRKGGANPDQQRVGDMFWGEGENLPSGSLVKGAEMQKSTTTRRSASLNQTPTGSAKLKPGRRSISKESPTYVEHLESQLAALHIQLQSLTSPSTTRSQSAKLRSLNAETTLLRAELADWETKFNDRVREQIEEHDAVVAGLRSQLRSMETESEIKNQKLAELELKAESKENSLNAVEAANQNLERRLEFMSELLATSPTKLDLHSEESSVMRSRSSRPLSLDPSLMSINTSGSPLRLSHRRSYHEASPLSPTLLARSRRPEESDYDSAESTPSRPASRSQLPSPERAKEKGVRRMRRFYTGSCGPRSLILPATAHAGSYPASAPVRDGSRNAHETLDDSGRSEKASYVDEVSQITPTNGPGLRRRSSSMSIGSRKELSTRTSGLSPALRSPYNFPAKTDHSSASRAQSPNSLEHVDSSHRTSLFEELSQLKLDASTAEPPSVAHRPLQDFFPSDSNPDPNSNSNSNPGVPSEPLSRSNRPPDTLFTRLTTSFRSYTLRARLVFVNAYSLTVLSRPALDFRWWLLGILLGPSRNTLFYPRHHYSPNHDHTQDHNLSPASQTPSTHLKTTWHPLLRTTFHRLPRSAHPSIAVHSTQRLLTPAPHRPPAPAPAPAGLATWLKFSVTLLLAVGIALREGPGALFQAAAAPCEEDASVIVHGQVETEEAPVVSDADTSGGREIEGCGRGAGCDGAAAEDGGGGADGDADGFGEGIHRRAADPDVCIHRNGLGQVLAAASAGQVER